MNASFQGNEAVSLHDIAPRLARARDQLLVARALEARRRLRHASERLRLERLVAHRELQLVRAQHTGRGKYIAVRLRKLQAAQRALRRFDGSVG